MIEITDMRSIAFCGLIVVEYSKGRINLLMGRWMPATSKQCIAAWWFVFDDGLLQLVRHIGRLSTQPNLPVPILSSAAVYMLNIIWDGAILKMVNILRLAVH